MNAYNTTELMICLAARFLEDGSTVVVGTGAPCAAAMLAQRRCAELDDHVRGRRRGSGAAHNADFGRGLTDLPSRSLRGEHG